MKNKLLKAKFILSVIGLSAVALFIGVPTISQEKLDRLMQAENQEQTKAQEVSTQEIF